MLNKVLTKEIYSITCFAQNTSAISAEAIKPHMCDRSCKVVLSLLAYTGIPECLQLFI
ncbi:hypothetical protein WKK05_39610 (plasmid) [Nostoc sp. UHCC 0302]|uniref:hypothetical protein n=1 Tax=Nostoc sp. UHCC 0302 TaxID=3134896 RepID=UPI00311C95E8